MFNKYAEYHAYWKNKKIEEIPSYTKGLKYKETYIDDMITLLQTRKIKFQFLEYLSTNPGINLHKLENLVYYAYKTMADGAMASSSTVTLVTVEGVDFEGKETGKVNVPEGVT